jgi:hypothetical protein
MAIPQHVIHRAELPIDDRAHGIDLTGDILHAAVRCEGSVDVWYYARRDQTVDHMRRSFQIVATGQPIPIWLARHHRTAISPDGQLVWHVLENACTHPNVIDTTEWGQLSHGGSGVCEDCDARVIADGQGVWTPC